MKRVAFVCSLLAGLVGTTAQGGSEDPLAGVRKDIEFAKPGGVSLTLDAFVPGGKGPFATCILVHGGGFTKGDKTSFIKPLFQPLANAGFTWFTINYRLAPDHRWPDCADDVAAAIRWVKAHAAEYQVDVTRIALIGESAGGHLVSWIGTRTEPDLKLAAVVPFYAPHDLAIQVRKRNELGPGIGGLLGMSEITEATWEAVRQISPSAFVHAGMPPYLLIHGDHDDKVPYEQSVLFQKQMIAAGNACDLITISGGGHGMGGWEKLNSNYARQMIDWLRKVLR